MLEKQPSNKSFNYLNLEDNYNNRKKLIILISVFAVLAIIFIVFINWPEKKQADKEKVEFNEESAISTAATTTKQEQIVKLPVFQGEKNGYENDKKTSVKAEFLSFGNFYEKSELVVESNIKQIDLPLDIKIDVSNFRDVTRKISIDEQVENLNNQGFAILDNPFKSQADDFFAIYSVLKLKEIPILVTSDFLIYLYQNNFKEVFKDVEENIFYNDMWDIASKLFLIADMRYRDQLEKKGMINDPSLEGARLASAYFATLLKILEPRKDQKIQSAGVKAFTQMEVNRYRFILPSYLQEDVTGFLKEDVIKEVNLITEARKKVKSPVLLYEKDYRIFDLPEDYKKSAKLSNFYLSTIWMNSIFPLHYKSNECEDCLLDKNDWLINIIAANFIANDFSKNQDLKNKWAKIYKTLSYFRGLKSGLTYLHYSEAFDDLFGKDRSIENVFSLNNEDVDSDIKKFQEKIASYKFFEIEGGLNIDASIDESLAGMRVLQEQYWPNDYIFNKLINPNVGDYHIESDIAPITGCRKNSKNASSIKRCKGLGMDIINLLVDAPIEEGYFQRNTNYKDYDKQADLVKDELNSFDVFVWHNNVYWNTLDVVKTFLNYETSKESNYPANSWMSKNINTSMGAWVNLHLPYDVLKIKVHGKESGFMASKVMDFNIEPNLALIEELIANTRMLKQMLLSLEIVNENSFSLIKLSNLEIEFENVKEVIIKELNNEDLDYNDFKKVDDLIKRFFVKEKGKKILKLDFKPTSNNIFESIDGVKLLLKISNIKNKNILLVGPIFNYKESKNY